MSDRLGYGILGTGNIANQFAEGVAGAERSRIVAVGSRSIESARAFASKHDVPAAYDSYQAMLDDPAVQAVYISLPNSMHYEWTLRALDAGRHVLCEKPFADDVEQATEMFDRAAERGLHLQEAFMYLSHPLTHAVRRALADGQIGSVQAIRASFCYRTKKIAGNTRFDPALKGGGLMDIGCYCISFARTMAGEEPDKVHAVGRLHDRGVDDIAAAVMHFPTGIVADFVCGMSAQADNTAYIFGDEGYIAIPIPWKPPVRGAQFTLRQQTPPRMDGGASDEPRDETFEIDTPKPLYALEADDFAAVVLDGATPVVTRDHSIGNQRILDQMRRQIGLSY